MEHQKITPDDIKIIQLLEKDARMSFRDIAKKLRVSEGTVYNRIKKMQDEGIILGFSARADPEKLQMGFMAVIYLKLDGARLADLQKDIAEHGEVRCLYDITGGYNTLIIARFRDKTEFNHFTKELLARHYVRDSMTYIVLNAIKEDFTVFGATPPPTRL